MKQKNADLRAGVSKTPAHIERREPAIPKCEPASR